MKILCRKRDALFTFENVLKFPAVFQVGQTAKHFQLFIGFKKFKKDVKIVTFGPLSLIFAASKGNS